MTAPLSTGSIREELYNKTTRKTSKEQEVVSNKCNLQGKVDNVQREQKRVIGQYSILKHRNDVASLQIQLYNDNKGSFIASTTKKEITS